MRIISHRICSNYDIPTHGVILQHLALECTFTFNMYLTIINDG